MSLWAFCLWHHPRISTQCKFLPFSVSPCCCIVPRLGNSWASHKFYAQTFAFHVPLVQVCIHRSTLKNDHSGPEKESMHLTVNGAEIVLSGRAGRRPKLQEVYKPTEASRRLRPQQAELINGFSCSRGRECWLQTSEMQWQLQVIRSQWCHSVSPEIKGSCYAALRHNDLYKKQFFILKSFHLFKGKKNNLPFFFSFYKYKLESAVFSPIWFLTLLQRANKTRTVLP